MLKSQPPVSVKGVAAIGAIVTLAALTGCVTRTKEVVVERPTQPATIVVQQPAAAPANVRTMPGPINEQRGVSPGAGYSWLTGYWAWDGYNYVWLEGRWLRQRSMMPASQASAAIVEPPSARRLPARRVSPPRIVLQWAIWVRRISASARVSSSRPGLRASSPATMAIVPSGVPSS